MRKYIWFDDVRDEKMQRVEFRFPDHLKAAVRDVAKVHGVSMNAFVTALLVWAMDADKHRRLRIDVEPSRVKVAEVRPGEAPAKLPEPPVIDGRPARYGRAKVR